MEGLKIIPLWCFVSRNTFQVNQDCNPLVFFFYDFLSVKDDQQQVWLNLTLSLLIAQQCCEALLPAVFYRLLPLSFCCQQIAPEI